MEDYERPANEERVRWINSRDYSIGDRDDLAILVDNKVYPRVFRKRRIAERRRIDPCSEAVQNRRRYSCADSTRTPGKCNQNDRALTNAGPRPPATTRLAHRRRHLRSLKRCWADAHVVHSSYET